MLVDRVRDSEVTNGSVIYIFMALMVVCSLVIAYFGGETGLKCLHEITVDLV